MILENYFDLLIDEKIDSITNSPICISGVDSIINYIYLELKDNFPEGKFQFNLKKYFPLPTIISWKNGVYPIPLVKLKQLLKLWGLVCQKNEKEIMTLYDKCFIQAKHFQAQNSPIKINVIKEITPDLAYFLGVLYADGSLRNVNLTFNQEKRFRWEITITDETPCNLEIISSQLETIFGNKTNVKKVYAGKWHRILFSSMILHRILNNVFEMPMGYKKGKLKIPKIIKNSPMEIKKHFLIGFFDGDGTCSRINNKKKFTPTISVSQSSKNILLELNDILNEKGINFNLYQKFSNNYIYYVLETKKKKTIKEFQESFGFKHPHKDKRLKTLVESFDKSKAAKSSYFSSYLEDTLL